jgi:AraC family transcriptional regulator
LNNSNIQIVRLGPMRVACINTFCISPEQEAWRKLIAWAGPKGLLKNRNEHPIFGFHNCNPTFPDTGSGFEIWIKVDSEIGPDGEVRIFEFPGGPYVVARCNTPTVDDQSKSNVWCNLIEWCKNNKVKHGYHQSFEKFISSDENFRNFILDLYFPIIY